jgi:ribosomal protein L37AE/L43A
MYITDLAHFLDKSGAIGPIKGPARAMAQFNVDVVAHASDPTGQALAAPRCFKCKKSTVQATHVHDDAIVWACPACRTEGRISNWKGSLWDLRDRPRALG